MVAVGSLEEVADGTQGLSCQSLAFESAVASSDLERGCILCSR